MSDVASMIRQAAAAYGLDPETMVRIAQRESSLNPNAANSKSSARGLFQFMTRPGGSWGEYGRGGNPLDPNANIDAGMRYTRDNVAHLSKALGRAPTPGEIYLAHQQGRAGALALLSNPQARAVDVIGRFYKNPQTANDAITLNGGRPDMTAAEFAAKWTHGFNGNATAPGVQPAAPQMATANPMQPQMRAAENPVSDALSALAAQMQPQQRPKGAPKQLVYG